MYNYIDAGQVSEFELYNVTTKYTMIYKKVLEYSELQLFAKYNRLCITIPQNLKTIAKQAFAYEKALNGFASQK